MSGNGGQDEPSSQAYPNAGTVLAFDFGLKRIGVAVGDVSVGVPHPLATITEEQTDRRFAAIETLIREWQPVVLVVGLPMHLDGTEHELAQTCRRFARRLEGRFDLPAVLVDERLTSAAANESLRETGIKGRRQKPMLDQVAAYHILQTYLDKKQHATSRR
jgi:putative Holliday junction resolvase